MAEGEVNITAFDDAGVLNGTEKLYVVRGTTDYNTTPDAIKTRVKGDIVNDLTTGGATKFASAETVKTLNTAKEAIKENVDSINVDKLGDVHAKSIDMDELPKVCGFPMYIISTTAPNVSPDFISQHWIDTVAKKVYVAVGVSSSADFVALN